MTAETPTPKPRKKPGPKPRKATDAALELRDIYLAVPNEHRVTIRSLVGVVCDESMPPTTIARIADLANDLDGDGLDLALDLFDVIDKRETDPK